MEVGSNAGYYGVYGGKSTRWHERVKHDGPREVL